MQIDIDRYEKATIEIAIEAGQLIKRLRASDVSVKYKGPVDLVTTADIRSQEFIIGALKAEFPEDDIMAEEGENTAATSPCLWLIDPIDGTTNYSHAYPVYCVSIGLFFEGRPILGVVYDPNLDELFVGVGGSKPQLNGEEIKVSETEKLSDSLLATGFPYNIREEPEIVLKQFCDFAVRAQGVRRAGAAALDLCGIACGRIDGFWETGLKPWDTAAAGFIAELAGAVASKYSGDAFDHFFPQALFSNGKIHREMIEVLRG